MRAVVNLSVRDQSEVAVIGSLLFVLLRTILVIDEDVDVDGALHVVLVLESDLEAAVSVPLDVDLALERVFRQWPRCRILLCFHLGHHTRLRLFDFLLSEWLAGLRVFHLLQLLHSFGHLLGLFGLRLDRHLLLLVAC